MPLPIFQPLDETAYDADRNVSTAHLKLLAENLMFSGNERQGLASVAYQKRLGPNGLRRLPQWTAAQWMLRGPFRVYVPGRRASQITAGYTRPKVVIKLRVVCNDGEVYAVAFAGPLPADFDAVATTIATTDTNVDLDCFGVVSGWNDVYIAVRGEALSVVETGTFDRVSYNVGFFYDESWLIDAPANGPAGFVPHSWIAVGTNASPSNWRDLLTINRASGANDADLIVGEILSEQPFGGTRFGSNNNDFSHGTLGYLDVEAMSVDFTQGVDVNDDQQWPSLRWWNLPSAFNIGVAVSSKVIAAHAARMPQLMLGNEQVFAVSPTSGVIGGQWRFERGGWSTKTEIVRFALFNAQRTLSNQTMRLEACIPLILVDVSGNEQGKSFTLTVDVYDEDGTTVALTEAGVPIAVGPAPVTQWVTARLMGLAESYETANNRQCLLDGFTYPADAARGIWSWVTATVDVSTLAADTLYFVAISLEGETSDSRTVATTGDVAVRYVYA